MQRACQEPRSPLRAPGGQPRIGLHFPAVRPSRRGLGIGSTTTMWCSTAKLNGDVYMRGLWQPPGSLEQERSYSEPSARVTVTVRSSSSPSTQSSQGLQHTSQSCTRLPWTSRSRYTSTSSPQLGTGDDEILFHQSEERRVGKECRS